MAQRAMLQCMYVNGIVICDVFDVVIWAVALQLLISPSLKARYHGLAIDRTYYSTLVSASTLSTADLASRNLPAHLRNLDHQCGLLRSSSLVPQLRREKKHLYE